MRKPTSSELTRAENVDQLMERSKGGVGKHARRRGGFVIWGCWLLLCVCFGIAGEGAALHVAAAIELYGLYV